MDFKDIISNDSESHITRQLMLTLRHELWSYQQHLKANPDPSDDWWFLVDPDTPEPTKSDWPTGG